MLLQLLQMKDCKSVLKNVFGYENFKSKIQEKAVVAIYTGVRYVLISMPPGFGRSLCYQLPVFLRKGVGIVFSPKLSLIKKEVDFLKSKCINVGLLSKNTKISERDNVINDLTSKYPKIILLYVTLEMSTMTYFKELLISLKKRNLLSHIVFNETHCLSEWGYDYKPGYKNINTFNKVLEHVPKIAVTTTVTNKVMIDICKFLTSEHVQIFKIPVQKINVYLDVWFVDILYDPIDHLKKFITTVLSLFDLSNKTHKGFGIIYCREVSTVELLQNKLKDLGVSTLVYHHKLKNSTQRRIENEWISEKIRVIITTYNYGFIYKKKIRCIVHWTVPENIAKYYRECAQTHLENDHAYCRIYFSTEEHSSVKLGIKNHKLINDLEHTQIRLNEYNKFVSYCLSIMCRHTIISRYFGHIMPPCKTNCDVCKDEETAMIRTHKFIAYSEGCKGVKYNIYDVNEDLKKHQQKQLEEQLDVIPKVKEAEVEKAAENSLKIEHTLTKVTKQSNVTPKIAEESKDSLETRHKLSESFDKKITLNKNFNVQFIKLNKGKQLPAENISLRKTDHSVDRDIKNNTENTVKPAKDNLLAIQSSIPVITQSLLNKYKLDTKAISLEPCTSRSNIYNSTKKIITIGSCSNKNERSSSNILKVDDEIKMGIGKEDRASRQNSRGPVIIEDKQLDKSLKKRFITVNTCPEKKRRKLELENKPTIGTEINRDGGNASGFCVGQIRDNTDENSTRDNKGIEYIINKYKLNKHSITLIPMKK
ncbi:ATP-dependent DNA helicase Q5-like isoform X1 [Frieseomelitta varia]|uniref:ATP-dependent DNA helicase Q5-like isoform X1 n=1 Tax=Frieseomelitta varia TaxID=561572 RepID=UPI001CB6B157|nr:ATP-dependent DNA helicase Q5-like isoform X1 [Frieseomelitta varia]